MNRRKFCLTSVAAAFSGSTTLSAGGEMPPASRPSIRIYKFIYDHRYPAGRAFGAAAEHAPSTAGTVATGGDITAFWSRDLRTEWTAGGGVIAGMATARTLFCLEQLAKDHWMRVLIRAEHAISAGHEIAHRLTGSEPMISRLNSALMARDWPRALPGVLTTCRRADGMPRLTRMIGAVRGEVWAATDDMLVSFVIA